MPANLIGAASVIKTLPVNEVLLKGKHNLFKYKKLILIFPGYREPIGMKEGFEKFCKDFSVEYEVITEFKKREIKTGEVYIIPNDRDLVSVIEKPKLQNLKLGQDFGIISYNETPLKKVVENGITTISTDFRAMGKIMAEMILGGKKKQIEKQMRLDYSQLFVKKCNLI